MAQAQTHTSTPARRSAGKSASTARRSTGAKRAGETRSFQPAHPVSDEVRKLAKDPDMSYGDIAEKVRERVPNSQTSAKTVATLVHNMRADGIDIPQRTVGRHNVH